MKRSLTIGWLYPELMSTYGDRGNIICLTKRCEWRNIQIAVKRLDMGFKANELLDCDLLFMGGAQDKQQSIVAKDFTTEKIQTLTQVVESAIPGLYVCGAYQFLGKYYKEADGTVVNGLGIFDLYTESPPENSERLIGNIAFNTSITLKSPFASAQDTKDPQIIIGFENHGGRTCLGNNIKPFGTVQVGFGNNGVDKTEGAMYKNSFGTYCHGPILPKNPHFADYLIKTALEKKYNTEITLETLDDTLEWQARDFITNLLLK